VLNQHKLESVALPAQDAGTTLTANVGKDTIG
jgi:hypothetical protein